jgi:hypothetical protein
MSKVYKKIFNKDASPLEIIEFVHQVDYEKYWLSIKKYEEALSEAQRDYYFGVVIKILSETEVYRGYQKDEIHLLMKIRYLKTDENILQSTTSGDPSEALIRIYRLFEDLTITQSDTGEFEAYLTRIRA